jgi:ABC-type transporter Mla subunit MlaD
MSNRTAPVDAVFAIQRSAIENTRDAFLSGIAFQRDVNEQFGIDLDLARDLNELEGDIVRNGTDAFFGAITAALPAQAGGIADLFDEVADQIKELEEQETELLADAIDSTEDALGDGSESVDELLADLVENIEEAADQLLETNEDLEESTAEQVEQLRDRLDELNERIEERGDELREQVGSVSEDIESAVDGATADESTA